MFPKSDEVQRILVRQKLVAPKEPDALLEVLRSIATSTEAIKRVTIEAGVVIIDKEVPSDQIKDDDASFYDNIRKTNIEEYEPEGKIPAHKQFFEACNTIAKEGFEISHLVVGKDTKLYKWLDLPRKLDYAFGIRIDKDFKIPSDVYILCGALRKNDDISDIKFAVKSTMV